ncbi:complement factor D-like [Vanessa cardui]|uniref:complement factor D-like n=1 Tax=Vanessa cardui TaxID=171605 RepID=UPI001F12BF33|nr:complement factor D-like [Vanessa cardui]
MSLKAGLLFVTLLIGGYAFPAPEQDMSIFFDHTDSSSRIIGGTTAGRVPFMVALSTGVYVRNLVCGGSLITNRHVMTAAHCIQAVFNGEHLLNSLRATVGTNRWNSGGTHYRIASNITHPNYVHNLIKNDIGILITADNVVMSTAVQPVALSYDFVGAGVPTTVTGWGRTITGGSMSRNLMQLSASVIDGNRCVNDVANRAAQLNMRVPDVQPHIEICTFVASGRGTCNGDSGSPLIRSDRQQQIGVVSWGLPCARGAPDMSLRGTVGTNRWNTGGTHYQFARNITHPNYVHSIIKNDIGILITRTNVALSSTVARVNLNYDFIGAGVRTLVHGWGRTSAGGSLSQVLLQLTATVIDGNRCVTDVRNRAAQLNIRAPAVQPHIELCTFNANGRGTCNGDSGSPLMRADRSQQIGVVSWGLPCARGAPDMFVRISAYRNWIQQNTR